ncbi:TPA: uroporphyrinogen-III synthase, partial [Campylobacter jejuni]|nr:uroporphyrinogen-III synthase [Campylobacter jejuni]
MQKCLYLRAKNIVSTLNLDLKNVGVDLDEMIVYENVFKKGDKKLIYPAIFIFTSPLSVENFLKFYSLKEEDKVVVIGQSTAKKLLNFKNLYICENQSLLDCVKLAKTLV